MAEHFSYWQTRNLDLQHPTKQQNSDSCKGCFFQQRTVEHPQGGCTHPHPDKQEHTCYTPLIEGDS